jgi:LemA protein
MATLLIAGIPIALLLLWAMISFNRFVSQRQLIDNSWSNVETELRRRHDLIPNLVETVQGYAEHEQATFVEVIEARRGAVAASGPADNHQGVEHALTVGLRQLMAVSEDYPDLLASQRFLDLQRELVTTEDRIQAARRLFNGNVRDYNRRVESIPSLMIAAIGRFSKADYFEVEAAVALVPSVRNII